MSTSPLTVLALDPAIYQDNYWCPNCAGLRVFLEVFEFEGGRLVCCQGCGDEKVLPFTRTTVDYPTVEECA